MVESPNISPDNVNHHGLEAEARTYLTERGFFCEQTAYHEVIGDKAAVERLQNINVPTALHVRHRPDRIAFHSIHDIAFQLEIKTHQSRQRHDICIDLIPFAMYLVNRKTFGAKTLFAYRDPYLSPVVDAGFWIGHAPPVRNIFVPPQPTEREQQYAHTLAELHFKEVDCKDIGRTGGTDDPFIVIDNEHLVELPHWQTLIDELLP